MSNEPARVFSIRLSDADRELLQRANHARWESLRQFAGATGIFEKPPALGRFILETATQAARDILKAQRIREILDEAEAARREEASAGDR